MSITVTPLTDAIGAEVSGVDLSGEIDADTVALIHQAGGVIPAVNALRS